MYQTMFKTVFTGMVCFFAGCVTEPEQFFIRDPLDIGKPLSEALKNECGIYIPADYTISSTGEFNRHTLLIIGEVEGHIDERLAALTMPTTKDFLFKGVLFMYASSEENCPANDEPCTIEKDTAVWENYKQFPQEYRTYRNERTVNKLFSSKYLNSSEYIFLMRKTNAKKFSKRLKEVVVEF